MCMNLKFTSTCRKGLKKHNVILDQDEKTVKVTTMLPQNETFIVHLQLQSDVRPTKTIRIGETSGKIEIDFLKCSAGRWQTIGTPLDQHCWFGDRKDVTDSYRDWRVVESRDVTHNTRYIVLQRPETCVMSVGPGHHVMIRAELENTEIVRPYTPVSSLDTDHAPDDGRLEFLIKMYPDGALTGSYLSRLGVGDSVRVSDCHGSFSMTQVPDHGHVTLLSAGTGITPMLTIMSTLSHQNQRPAVKLVTFDKTPADIIWRDEVTRNHLQIIFSINFSRFKDSNQRTLTG